MQKTLLEEPVISGSELFIKGGFMMWFILIASFAAVGLTVERIFYLRAAARGNAALRKKLSDGAGGENLLGAVATIESPASAVVEVGLKNLQCGVAKSAAAVMREGARQRRLLEKNVASVGIISKITPLMGLLGTVIGMINAFMVIQSQRGMVEPDMLAGGIWQALITTAAGLLVAIPTLLLYHYLEGRVDELGEEMLDIIAMVPGLEEVLLIGEIGGER